MVKLVDIKRLALALTGIRWTGIFAKFYLFRIGLTLLTSKNGNGRHALNNRCVC